MQVHAQFPEVPRTWSARSAGVTTRPLGKAQISILQEAGSEVAGACPWIPIYGDRKVVRSLVARGLLGATLDLFGIMPRGCLVLRRYDRALARRALAGLRRNRDAGEVMPWHVLEIWRMNDVFGQAPPSMMETDR